MIDLVAVLAGGLLGSAHCMGMCGGFAATLGVSDHRGLSAVTRQLVYSLGRICTYAFLGAVGGAAGGYLEQFKMPLIGAQRAFAVLAGLIMLLVGLSVLGVFRFGRPSASSSEPGLLASMFGQFLNARGHSGCLSAGLATGFLPCGLVYAFLAMAVATGDVVNGAMVMACFGLGTVPVMVAIGCGSSLLSHSLRITVFKLAACLMVALGGVTVYRALPTQGHAGHHGPGWRMPTGAP